jgi:hypothetical protein
LTKLRRPILSSLNTPSFRNQFTLELLLIDTIAGINHPTLGGGLIVAQILPGDSAQVLRQSLLTRLMLGMSLVDLLQAVPHQELVVSSRKNRRRDVNEDRNP